MEWVQVLQPHLQTAIKNTHNLNHTTTIRKPMETLPNPVSTKCTRTRYGYHREGKKACNGTDVQVQYGHGKGSRQTETKWGTHVCMIRGTRTDHAYNKQPYKASTPHYHKGKHQHTYACHDAFTWSPCLSYATVIWLPKLGWSPVLTGADTDTGISTDKESVTLTTHNSTMLLVPENVCAIFVRRE